MGNSISKGLMAFWTDIDEDYVLEFQKWHNCEHMTERVSIPGFHVGRRYRGIGNAPMFLITYETAGSEVLKSEAYMKALNSPTPWTKEALTHFTNNIRNIYSIVAVEGTPAATEATYVFVARFNFDPEAEREGIGWYAKAYLPQVCAIPGVYRGKFYEIDEKTSSIMTKERQIYGGGPGQQKYLAVYEIGSIDLPSAGAWQEINEAGGGNREMLRNRRDVYEEFSWLEFVMYAPEPPPN